MPRCAYFGGVKFFHLVPAAAVFVTTFCAAARADDAKDALVAAEKAAKDAPAYRLKVTSTDPTTKVAAAMTIEIVNPETMHLKSESGGQSQMEVYSDGQKVFMSHAGSPMQEAPPQVAAMMKQMKDQVSGDAMSKLAQNAKFVGHETVGGTPASVYTFEADMMGMHMASKEWVSDKDHRPIKVESVTKGSVANQEVNQNTTATYEFDPSIKVVMPQP